MKNDLITIFRWQLTSRLASLLLWIAAVVLLNFASTSLFFQADFTEDKIHSLAPQSIETVSRLREPLTIHGFFSSDLQAPFNNIERTVRDLLDSYAEHGGDFFNSTIHTIGDSLNSDANERLAHDYLIYPIQVEQIDRTEAVVRSVFSGLALVHGDLVETIGALTSTVELEMKITEAIGRLTNRVSLLLGLEEDISAKLYFSSELSLLSPELKALPSAVAKIIADLNGSYFDRLEFTAIDPSLSELNWTDARRLQLTPLRLRSSDGSDHFAYAGIVLHSNEKSLTLNLIETTQKGARVADLETIRRSVDSTLKGLLGSQPEIGYLADFGTPPYRGNLPEGRQPVSTDLANLYSLLSRDYQYYGLLLSDHEIPPQLRTLLIVSPQEMLTEWALFQIDQHLMRGGSVIAFLDTHSTFTREAFGGGSSVQVPLKTGLENLFIHYGMRLRPTYVLDNEQSFVQIQPNTSGGVIKSQLPFVPIIRRSNMDTSWPPLTRLDQILVMKTSPLELTGTQPHARFVKVLSSSTTAWEVTGTTDLIDPQATASPLANRRSSFLLAGYAEGRFTSYFADRIPPRRPVNENDTNEVITLLSNKLLESSPQVLPESAPGAQLFLIGTSTILGNNFIDPTQLGPNTMLVHNVVDHLSGQQGRAALRGRSSLVRRINTFTTTEQNVVKTFLIAGPPSLVVLTGAAFWLWGRVRQRRIQLRSTKMTKLSPGQIRS